MIDFSTADITLEFANNWPCPQSSKISDRLLSQNPSPITFSFPHSGRHYPDDFIKKSRLDILSLRSSEDAFVDDLFGDISALGANKLVAHFPRAYVDVNRNADDLDPELFIDKIDIPSHRLLPLVRAGIGVIARVVCNQQHIYHGKIPLQEAKQRLVKHYHPYHFILQKLTQYAGQKFGYSLLVDCHSMPSTFSKNRPAPDFIIGNVFDSSCAPQISQAIYKFLDSRGYDVIFNQPYAGGTITQQYHQRDRGFHTLQLEINRVLYMDEQTIKKSPNFKNLKMDMAQLVKIITNLNTQFLTPIQNIAQ